MKSEIYFSTDVETDGPSPGLNSMLSLGSVVYNTQFEEIGEFSINLEPRPNAIQDPYTMKWWDKHPAAWEAARRNPVASGEAMVAYVKWVRSFPGIPVFVASPAVFDWGFVERYLQLYVGINPFHFNVIDIDSYAMAMLRLPISSCHKANYPPHWIPEEKHTHIAIEDAREQGKLFMNMFRENLAMV